jgi:hypothetical protein
MFNEENKFIFQFKMRFNVDFTLSNMLLFLLDKSYRIKINLIQNNLLTAAIEVEKVFLDPLKLKKFI